MLGCEGTECRLMNCCAAIDRWSVASTLFNAEPMKKGWTVDKDEPVEMVDGLFVPSITESFRKGGVGGIEVCCEWL